MTLGAKGVLDEGHTCNIPASISLFLLVKSVLIEENTLLLKNGTTTTITFIALFSKVWHFLLSAQLIAMFKISHLCYCSNLQGHFVIL